MLVRTRCSHILRLELRSSASQQNAKSQRCQATNASSVPVKITKHFVSPPKNSFASFYKLKVDPWVFPESLKETLEEHRRANRAGEAVDGIPIQSVRNSRRRSRRITTVGDGERLPTQKEFRRLDLSTRTVEDDEYEGRVKSLTADWKTVKILPKRVRAPWAHFLALDKSISHNVPAVQRLSDELHAVQSYLSPTSKENESAQKVIDYVLNLLNHIPESNSLTCSVTGSRAASVHGPLSDIDLAITVDGNHQPTRAESTSLLQTIFKSLKYRSSQTHETSEFVAHRLQRGRVPLIDCGHLPSGLSIQIQAPQNDYDTTEITKAHLAEFRALRQVYLMIKQMLCMRGLNDGQHGGIGSYPLFQMVVTSFKLHSNITDPVSQLLSFLKFYSDIDFYTTAIEYHQKASAGVGASSESLVNTGYDPLSLQPMLVPHKTIGPQYLMSLEDPANPDNDLGRAALLIKHIQATFIEAQEQINKAMEHWDQMYKRGVNMKRYGQPILSWCLEGNYARFERRRQRLRSFALSTDK